MPPRRHDPAPVVAGLALCVLAAALAAAGRAPPDLERGWRLEHRARALVARGAAIEALPLWRESITIDPTRTARRVEAAVSEVLMTTHGVPTTALQELHAIVTRDPSCARAAAALGFVAVDGEAGTPWLERAVHYEPGIPHVATMTATRLLSAGRIDDATRLMGIAADRHPDCASTLWARSR